MLAVDNPSASIYTTHYQSKILTTYHVNVVQIYFHLVVVFVKQINSQTSLFTAVVIIMSHYAFKSKNLLGGLTINKNLTDSVTSV